MNRPNCMSSVQVAFKQNLMAYFKHRHRLIKTDFKSVFCQVNDGYETRAKNRNDLKTRKCRLQMFSNKYVNVTTKLFNLMDPVQRSTKLMTVFEREATRMLLCHF